MMRHFVAVRAIHANAEARALMVQVMADVIKAFQPHRGCDELELQAVLDIMNAPPIEDVSNRFLYCEFLGGLVHIQFSIVPGEACWVLMPQRCFATPLLPFERVCMQYNGLMCTRAPAAALSAWQDGPGRHQILVNPTRAFNCDVVKPCANCVRIRNSGPMRACTGCMLVRYCSPLCQSSHWPVHKHLCRWARACINNQWG